jgi:hypothetical protein
LDFNWDLGLGIWSFHHGVNTKFVTQRIRAASSCETLSFRLKYLHAIRSVRRKTDQCCPMKPVMTQTTDPMDKLREHLLELLGKGSAHADYASTVANLPARKRGEKVPGAPHSAWRLVEHMRITQRDIMEFTRDARHVSPKWPDEYWPAGDAPPSAKAWNASIASFKKDRAAMIAIVKDAASDLLAPLPHGQGQTIAREAMLLADHTAYHVGQLILLRRALGAWKD